jgi:hypothetical protein
MVKRYRAFLSESDNKAAKDTDIEEIQTLVGKTYGSDYKEGVFWLWYRTDKPQARVLYNKIEPDLDGTVPSRQTLSKWINDFVIRAREIDAQVQSEMQKISVREKVEMLNRHSEIGVEIQNMAIEYLRNNKDKIKENTALRMLVEGIRIERESRGLPTLITKTVDASDEKLMEEIENLLKSGGIDEMTDDENVIDIQEEADIDE